MPRIELIPVPLFTANDPYHWVYDNIPLQNLMRRQNLINMSLDNVIDQITDAIGSQGSISNRLNQSIEEDGGLKKDAVDETLHGMEYHTDDTWGDDVEYDAWIATRTGPFVRFTKEESDKLSDIASGATDFWVRVQLDDDGDDLADFDAGMLTLIPSSTLTYEITSGNKLSFHLNFPVESAHAHYYDLEPVHADTGDPDYKNYKVNSIASPYMEDTLRVYVNGLRLSASASIYAPGQLVNDPWTALTFTPDHEAGTFELSAALSEDDVIRVDFDIAYIS